MNKKAFIGGQEYTAVEKLFSLENGQSVIICADERGEKYTCSEVFWQNSAPKIEQTAPIHTHSSAKEKVDFFLSVFKGRSDLYAKRYYSEKTGKSGYTPVCKNEWSYGLCDKRKYKCADCPNREFTPLSAEAVKAHLIGQDVFFRDVAAIYPMLEDNTTYLLVADFDEKNWQADVSAFCKCCKEFGITPAVERSRSGNGAHVWFFFSDPVSAADARRLGSGLLTQTMTRRHELSFNSYDRLFPSQDAVPKGGFGNLIALPFQGQAQKDGNSLFVDEQFTPYQDQWAFLSSLPKITPEQLQGYLQKLCCNGELGELADTEEKQAPWQHKRTRSKLTNKDFPVQTRLVLSNLIYINKHGFSQAALNAIKRLAAFLNPEFCKKQAMRLPLYNVPRVIDCSYEDDPYIGIPRGCTDALTELLEQYEVSFFFDDKRCAGHSVDVDFNGTLREEQLPAAEALLSEDMGVLSATTAFGKTVIGAYLIGQRKVNTLILVHSAALLEQWKSSLEQFLDIHEILPEPTKKRGRKRKQSLIGQIGSGKNARGGIVDIAIMQSLFEGEEKTVKSFVSEYGMVNDGIIQRYKGNILDLFVPETINGITVTGFSKGAFNTVIGLTLPETVTEIPVSAFSKNDKIEFVRGEGVVTVKSGAFSQSNIMNVEFPVAKYIQGNAFYLASKFCSGDFSNVETIDGGAFSYSRIIFFYGPEVQELDDGAFGQCPRLESVYLPNCTTINKNWGGNGAFESCSRLTSADMPLITNLTANAFRDTAISKADFSFVETIAKNTF